MEYQTDGRTLGHDSWIAICAYASLQDWEFSGAVICLLPCKDLGNIVVNTLHMCDLQRCFYKTVTGNMWHFLGTPYRYKDHHKIPLGRVLVIVQQENNGRFPNDRSVAWRQIECRGLSRRCLQETLYKPSNMFKKKSFFSFYNCNMFRPAVRTETKVKYCNWTLIDPSILSMSKH